MKTGFVRMIGGRPGSAIAVAALSSIGNVSLSLRTAQMSTLVELGMFVLTFSVYVLVTGLIRAMVTEAVLVDGPSELTIRSGARRAVAVGFLAAAITSVAGIGTGSIYLLLLGLALPGLVLQDYFKVLTLAGDRPRMAIAQEAAWTILTMAGVVASLLFGGSAAYVFAAWAVSGAVVGFVIAVVRRCPFLPGWVGQHRETRMTLAFGAQFLVTSGSAQLALTAMAATAGASVVGALGAARLVLGPVTLLVSAGTLLITSYLARHSTLNPADQLRYSLRITISFAAALAPVAVLCTLVPSDWGHALLGASWGAARPLIPLLAVESLIAGMSLVAFAGHRVERAGSRTLVIGLLLGPVRILALVLAGQAFGARGAAYTLILLALLSFVVWWVSYLHLLRRAPDCLA